jgi:hypothetical protein
MGDEGGTKEVSIACLSPYLGVIKEDNKVHQTEE